jgi:hypothetical protein
MRKAQLAAQWRSLINVAAKMAQWRKWLNGVIGGVMTSINGDSQLMKESCNQMRWRKWLAAAKAASGAISVGIWRK